jgi:hypothetical protein
VAAARDRIIKEPEETSIERQKNGRFWNWLRAAF